MMLSCDVQYIFTFLKFYFLASSCCGEQYTVLTDQTCTYHFAAIIHIKIMNNIQLKIKKQVYNLFLDIFG